MLSRSLFLLLVAVAGSSLGACTSSSSDGAEPDVGTGYSGVLPIVSTGDDQLRDLIRPGDPSAFACLIDLGTGPGEFYDKVEDDLVFPDNTHFFEARYTDGSTVEICIHPELLVDVSPVVQAERIAMPIGLLPTELRAGIERVGFLDGDATAQADGGGEGIHVYEDNVTVRESTNRFEETLFHESVHTSLDDTYASSTGWTAAQAADGEYLTQYAAQEPDREDLAETALYAWALQHHPDRISLEDADDWSAKVPNRLAFIGAVLSAPGEGASETPDNC